jgi:nitrogen fixation protein FixH
MIDHPWEHPVVRRDHVVSMTRDYPDGVAWSVATCQCGWTARETVADQAARYRAARTNGKRASLDAVEAHWRDVIAQAEGAAA